MADGASIDHTTLHCLGHHLWCVVGQVIAWQAACKRLPLSQACSKACEKVEESRACSRGRVVVTRTAHDAIQSLSAFVGAVNVYRRAERGPGLLSLFYRQRRPVNFALSLRHAYCGGYDECWIVDASFGSTASVPSAA